MTIVSPSILSANFSSLGADCRMVLDAGAQMLHYDVMDGKIIKAASFWQNAANQFMVHFAGDRKSTRLNSSHRT